MQTSALDLVRRAAGYLPRTDIDEGGLLMDWTQLLTPVVVAVIPMLVAIAKGWIPPRFKVLYPALATVLGPLVELLVAWLQARQADPKWGVAMGLMAIGVRELVDQLRSLPAGPRVARVIVLALLLPALSGCGTMFGYGGMTPAQLRELAKDRTSGFTCFAGIYAGAKVTILIVHADRGVPAGVQVGDDCKASFLAGQARPVE